MHPSFYKRPLFLVLLLYITILWLCYKPVVSLTDVSAFTGKTVTVRGRVENFSVAKPKSNNVIVRVQHINGQKADGKLYVRFENFEPQWKDTVEFSGLVKTPFGADLLGNFNWRHYLANKHVFAEVKTTDGQLIKSAAWPFVALRKVRRSILMTFEDKLPSSLSVLADGVLLGERSDLDPSLFTAFQDSGAIHLLVASGGNVGFVTLITLAVCGLLNIPRKKALLVSLVVAGFYTLLAGADAPLVRAYLMTVGAVSGYLLGRNSGVFQGLLLSCLVILLFTPAALFETGFQMSFLATLAIVMCVGNFALPVKWPKWVRFFGEIFIITLAVQLILLPIFTNVFYKISVIGLVANMVLVPFASWLLGLSAGYYICEVLHVGFLLYFPTVWSLALFQKLVAFFASVPFASIPVTAWQPTTMAAYWTGLFLLFNLPLKSFIRKIWLPCVILIMVLLGVSYLNTRRVWVAILDQYGVQTVLVRTPSDTFVFGTNLAPEQIKNALYALGRTSVTGVFSFSGKKPKQNLADFVPVEKIIFPFQEAWPEETWSFKTTRVTLKWGISTLPDGTVIEHKGYTGTKEDKISYCISATRVDFCIGENGRFVLPENGKIHFARRNKTTFFKI